MGKYLSVVLLALALIAPVKAEAVAPPVVNPIWLGGGVSGGPELLPFLSAVTLGFGVVVLNAEGVPFPLCGFEGLKCFAEYPGDKNGG